jgi:hypothetical protein
MPAWKDTLTEQERWRGLQLMEKDEPGFWETHHMYGDPWLEQRYSGD